jgi:hypothetical protein
MLSAGYDRIIRLWDLRSAREVDASKAARTGS